MFHRYKGCIYGLAIGDALGATNEGKSYGDCWKKPVTDIMGGGWLHLEPGEWTDDTAMALCLADSLIARKGIHLEDISKRYMDWVASGPKDVGNTVRAAVHNLFNGVPPNRSGIPAPMESNGCIMRCAPMALAYFNSPRLGAYSKHESAITHASPMCTDATAFVNCLIAGLVKNDEYGGLLRKLCSPDDYHSRFRELAFTKEPQNTPSGHIPQTLKAVFYALNSTNSFEDTLIDVVNRGGDADTTGAIAGAIAGARYGFWGIPDRWVKKIKNPKRLEQVAADLHKLALEHFENKPENHHKLFYDY